MSFLLPRIAVILLLLTIFAPARMSELFSILLGPVLTLLIVLAGCRIILSGLLGSGRRR
jgi:hypothetical protein